MLLLGISVSGCGKTREVDEASSKVIQISVAPEETSPTPAPDQVASAGFRLKIQGKSEPVGGEIHGKPGPGHLSEHLILIDKIAFHDGRRQHEEIGRGDMKLYALTTGAGRRKRDGKLQPCHFQT